MNLPLFKLEEFWKKYEFKTPHHLCCSDAETWSVKEILALADAEAKELWENLTLAYTEAPGHPLLRREIAKLYSSIDESEVFTFAGAEEGIYCAIRALVEPGDHVIVITPCYQSLETLPRNFGAEVTAIALEMEKNWKLDLDAVKKAFRPTTKLLVLNYPHNPTGAILESFDELIKLARESDAYIFCDEVYRYLEIDEERRLPSIADAYEKGIALNVMTKSFGLAGLRIGWLASRDKKALEAAGSYKLYTSICNSAPSEILALIALRAKEKILQRNREILRNNLGLLDRFMERQRGRLSWIRPQGGTMALIKLLLPEPVEKFAEDLVEEMGILIMPGSVFDLPDNFFRIGFGKRNMAVILERFEQFLRNRTQICYR